MKIRSITTTPLHVPYKTPFHWARGVIEGADVLLVEIETDTGISGFGECISAPDGMALKALVDQAGALLIGRNAFHTRALMHEAYTALFRAQAVCSAPRFAGQVLAGLEMALWDVLGKSTGQSVHALLGGAVHGQIGYHGFAMGATPDEVATDAKSFADRGFEVIYLKAGFGMARDLASVRAVRKAIGPDPRLRIDPNESWSPLEAKQMIARLAPYDLEFIEQPTQCESISALAQVRAASPVGIAADQSVFTPNEAFALLQAQAADLIVIGPHECGGLAHMTDIARLAQLAGVNICIHGLYETGITTCAAHMAAAACPNLDDGNQHMLKFLEWDIIDPPDLMPKAGKVPVLNGPGLGFELNTDNVARAAARFQARQG
ncbi:MAG: mandelate racemase/muconate lactonizing enzyme family protein [Paracoccaceae bacterium]|uniref:mandelate racemase/muconate lactonizing enzyme family protein n=1 Tax=Yoonia sp. TaxID=2212373 RepID=UPI00328BB3D9